ncbi:MAG: hypothetical protein ACFHHU_00085 [Porticoccaceae bacterium]
MANLYLSELIAAANGMSRPRFANSLVLVMASLADETGLVHASRDDLAELVDRSEFHSRHGERLARVESRTRAYKANMACLQKQLDDGEIGKAFFDHEVGLLTDEHRKYVRSPTLANVSNVISTFKQLNLMSVSYVDPETGQEFDTTARGRYARYRFVLPKGSMQVFQEQEVGDQSLGKRSARSSGSGNVAKPTPRPAKPVSQPPQSASKSVGNNAHQLSLL